MIVQDRERDALVQLYPLLECFAGALYSLPEQEVAGPIGDLAWSAALSLCARGFGDAVSREEFRAGLRKLLEARDCLVRARLRVERLAVLDHYPENPDAGDVSRSGLNPNP